MKAETLLYELARAAQQKAAQARRRKAAGGKRQPARAIDTLQSPTQKAGLDAEERASQYLQARGLVMLERNLRSKTGEIDLVANDHGTLAFIEVRHRRSRQYGGAAASVNLNKQRRLVRTAQFFLPRLIRRHFQGNPPACRFDVVSVEPAGLDWIRGAFDA